jgi:hypothetical protein
MLPGFLSQRESSAMTLASDSTLLIVAPLQTASKVEIAMIVVLPQTEHLHRSANGEAAAVQAQLVSRCFIGATSLLFFGFF